jgi:ADP-ribose pyrophosphatase
MVEEGVMNNRKLPSDRWRCLSSHEVYTSSHVQIYSDSVQLPDGTVIQYTRFDDCPFTIVVPTVAEGLIMIYNYRYPLNKWCLEFPSGHVEPKETPEEAARRELEEETGYVAKELRVVGEFYPSVRSRQKAYVFTAEAMEKGTTSRNASELQRVVVLPTNEIYAKLSAGEIKHAASIIAFTLAQPCLGKNKR